MTAGGSIGAVDELRGHMRRRGFEASEVEVDFDQNGGVIVRARFEPAAPINPAATWPKGDADVGYRPSFTPHDVAKAVSHEQGMNVWKGAALVALLAFLVFVAGALGWI
jgi:hypothetical protein